MIRRPPRSTLSSSSAASDVYKRQSIVDLTEDADVEILDDFLSERPTYRRPISPPSRPGSSLPATRAPRLPTRPAARLPRYPNPIFDEIIDLEALPDQDIIPPSNDTINEQPPHDPTSPEVTFIRSVPRPLPPQPPGVRLMDLTRQYYQEHGVPGRLPIPHAWPHAGRNMGLAGFLPHGDFAEEPLILIDEASGYPVPQLPTQGPPRARPGGHRGGVTVPTALGFGADRMRQFMALGHTQQGFHYQPFVPATPPEPLGPGYDPLPPPNPDFTRSPGEDDKLVCPRCEDELCKGESEIKQQAWVVKACGHVSCHVYIRTDDANVRASGLLWRLCKRSSEIKRSQGRTG